MTDVQDEQGQRPAGGGTVGAARDVFARGGPVGAALADVEWSGTALGEPASWPRSLTLAVSTILRSRFSMWMAWGPDLTFFCNDAYRRDTLGAKYPWALGRPAREVWAEIWPDIRPRIDRVLATGEATWDEALLLFVERSGYREESYHTFSYSPLIDDDGAVTGMLCVVTEDTERVIGARRMATLRDLGVGRGADTSAEEVLASSAAALGTNPRDLPFSLLYTFDDDGRTAGLRATSGLDGRHPMAPDAIDCSSPNAPWGASEVRAGSTVLVDDLGAAGVAAPSGAWDEPPLQALVVPLAGQGQSAPAGFLVAGVNRYRLLDDGYRGFLGLVAGQVAARLAAAQAYEAERSRAEQLAELDRAKTAFFTNVSHEFRTPLTLLLGPAEDALADRGEALGPAQRERLEVVQRNALRLLKLVNTLLDFSRLESGRLDARFAPTDLSRVTAELASAFASATDRVGLTLTVDCPPLAEPVWVDQDLWGKLVLNLLSNALKFTFEGGITVSLRPDGDHVVLAVEDTGVGISAEEQGRLFERFYRAAAPRARTHEGSGIGLALVAEVAALHGGAVAVTSTPGQGSEFEVRIPLGRAHLPSDQVMLVAPAEGQRPTRAPAAGFLAETTRWLGAEEPRPAPRSPDAGDDRPRVLVIDDNADMREYLERLLSSDYTVMTAGDGVAGIAAARKHLPDLVLSDVMMPGLDGFGVLATLRREPLTQHIPVVLLSARAGEESTVEGLEAGADDYLIKPFTARELLARVGANLELDRSRRTREHLERNQALLDQTQRLARIGSWELDLATRRVTASTEMRRQLRILSDEEVGAQNVERALDAGVVPDHAAVLRAAIARTASTGEPMEVELRVDAGDGREWVYRVLGELVRDSGGAPLLIRGSCQDVTDQRAAERAVAAAAAAREAAAREHRIADELQRSLVPAPAFSPDNLTIATYYRPGVEGTQVGGDWYDVIELGAGRTALVLGDVMGRGVQAAAVMGQLRAAIRAYARLDLPPADVLELLDAAVRSLGEDQIVTAVYAVYDPGEGTLSYANAGHIPPILCLPGAVPCRLDGGAGPPLGVGPLTVAAGQIDLPPGSMLALYTDGLVERRGSDIDSGIDRLLALLAPPPADIADLPARMVEELLPEGPDDDVAVLLASVASAPLPGRTASLRLASEERAVHEARSFVSATLDDWGLPAGVTEDAVLVASELITNAVLHGKAPVELRLRATATDLVLQALDGATSLPQRMRPTADDEHGRGLQIVALLAARWGTRPTASGKAVWCMLPIG